MLEIVHILLPVNREVVTPNTYQRYDWDQNYFSAETGHTGANHVQYYKYGLLHLSVPILRE